MAALEFAILAPMLVLLLLGGTDLTFWYLKKFRLDNAAAAVGNIVAAQTSLALTAFPANYCSTTSTATNYFAVASELSLPMTVCGTGGATIISGLSNNGTTTTVAWQERTGSSASFPSLFGTVGSTPTLPPGYSVPSNHNVIATELYSDVTTWSTPVQTIIGAAGSNVLYSYTLFEPRTGQLATPQ
jgi:Flp pilus assembly protein TadG